MKYDYRKAMVEDIKEYIKDEIYLTEYSDKFEAEQDLYEKMWIADSVTGNASGSYTFNRWKAEEYVKDNLRLYIDAMDMIGGTPEDIEKDLYDERWECMDVTIRCYLLYECISEVLEEYEEVWA